MAASVPLTTMLAEAAAQERAEAVPALEALALAVARPPTADQARARPETEAQG